MGGRPFHLAQSGDLGRRLPLLALLVLLVLAQDPRMGNHHQAAFGSAASFDCNLQGDLAGWEAFDHMEVADSVACLADHMEVAD